MFNVHTVRFVGSAGLNHVQNTGAGQAFKNGGRIESDVRPHSGRFLSPPCPIESSFLHPVKAQRLDRKRGVGKNQRSFHRRIGEDRLPQQQIRGRKQNDIATPFQAGDVQLEPSVRVECGKG